MSFIGMERRSEVRADTLCRSWQSRRGLVVGVIDANECYQYYSDYVSDVATIEHQSFSQPLRDMINDCKC